MPTNYKILLESEKKLSSLLIEYFDYVKYMHSRVWELALSNVRETEENNLVSISERRMTKSKLMSENLSDECIWIISKDEPRANHLKYIISIIQNSKDLEMASEYSKKIAKKIYWKKISVENLSKLKPLVDKYLKVFDDSMKIFNSKSITKYEEITKVFDNYEDFEYKFAKNMKIEFKDNYEETDYFVLSRLIKHMSSTITRISTIFESNFFDRHICTEKNKTKK